MNKKVGTLLRRTGQKKGSLSSATITSLAQIATLSVAVAITLTSCQSFSSDAVSEDNSNVQSGIGILYYLPWGRVHVVGSFTSTNKVTVSGAGQQDAVDSKAVAPAPIVATDPQQAPQTGDVASPTPDLSQAASTNIPPRPKHSQAIAATPAPAPGAAPAPAPGDQTQSFDPRTYSVTIGGDINADPRANYLLRPVHDYFADDSSHLSVDSKGLLSSSSATNTDETAAIFTNAVSMAALFGGTKPNAPLPLLAPFDLYFDPDDQTQIKDANTKIQTATNGRLSLSVYRIQTPTTSDFALPTKHDGILYRRMIPYRIVIEGDLGAGFRINANQYVLLPDKRTLFSVDFNRMPFVQKVTTVTFTNGVPIAYSESVPSPVLGLMGIPKSIIQALLPIPAGASTATGVASKSQ